MNLILLCSTTEDQLGLQSVLIDYEGSSKQESNDNKLSLTPGGR